jgi:dCTP deaminase
MFLSDIDIQNAIKTGDIILPDFDPNRLQPASYDVLLGNEFMVFESHKADSIDPRESVEGYMKKVTISDGDFFVLHPQEFALAVTADFFGVSNKLCCQIMGKSSLARLGLIIHTTAGFVDPGNQLKATLELVNTNKLPIKLYPGMKIGQLAFCQLLTPAQKSYGHKDLNSKYYNAQEVQASRMHRNFGEGR